MIAAKGTPIVVELSGMRKMIVSIKFSAYLAQALARISHQRSLGVEADARRQGCRGGIHRARDPTYRPLGDVHNLFPQAMARRVVSLQSL